ncbi:MAG: diaminopimelate decarboxylase [Cellvibrionaceae bacterium]|nr:diaminopimelate decarboxylase [Cellvibrionaceae bacterium]
MPHFNYRNNTLLAERCSLEDIATEFGTPCYVYSKAAFTEHYLSYQRALSDVKGNICYAVKANSNLAILQLLAKLGAGFDIVSKGELQRVIAAGGDPQKTLFSGVGKTPEEMAFALEKQVGCFNVESSEELLALSEVARAAGKTAAVSLRVNPDVDAKTHPYISTGLKDNKFGIDINLAVEVYQKAHDLPGIEVVGVDCHIGSQLTQLEPFLDALERILMLVDKLHDLGIELQHIDLGGGLGVTYNDEKPPAVTDYLNRVKQRLAGRNLSLFLEPGRSIAANAGVLLTQVIYLKPTAHKNFAVVDAAMNDNIRPALYQAWQKVQVVSPKSGKNRQWDIVGPVCETGDFLAKNRELSLAQGDRLALMSSGAYGFAMSSNYNSRGRAAEVLVDGDRAHLIRERESFTDLIRGEHLLKEAAD